MSFSRIVDLEAYNQALRLTRGSYQRAILEGTEALSGSTLHGSAALFSSRYKRSSQRLLERMTKAGIPWRIERGPKNKKILVIGE